MDPINSVQFSNHTGYAGGWRGEVLQGEQLWALIEGLQTNGLLHGYTHLLTGYIGSASFLRTVLRALRELRAVNPSMSYHCDPVMGDLGKLYVPDELVAIYREEVVPLARCAARARPRAAGARAHRRSHSRSPPQRDYAEPL